MQHQLAELRQENGNLKDELEAAKASSSFGSKSQLQRRIRELETVRASYHSVY